MRLLAIGLAISLAACASTPPAEVPAYQHRFANAVEWSKKFWELGPEIWNQTLDTVSVCWLTSVYAAKVMTRQGSGLIVHVTDNHYPDVSSYRGQILHDLGHEALNRLISAMARETKQSQVAVVGLNPGFMRTERVLMHMTTEEAKRQFRFDLSESPEYIGRAVAALAADREVMQKNGELLWACDLAKEYGFTDVDGRYIPRFDPTAPRQEYPCVNTSARTSGQAAR